MLPRSARLHRSSDFSEVVRRGRRASRGAVTVHLAVPAAAPPPAPPGVHPLPAEGELPARAGLVVSRAVGGSVVRHAVSRRLRHLLRERLVQLPAGSRLVVRAAPSAAAAGSAELGADLDAALAAALRRGPRPGTSS